MAKAFNATIRGWVNKTKRQQEAILKGSVQDVFAQAQTPQASVKKTGGSFEVGKIPVDHGDLRGSFVSGLNGGGFTKGEEAYVLTVSQAKVGDTIMGGWRADHAPAIEFGTESDTDGVNNIEPRAFMRTAAGNWRQIVRANVRKAKAMS